MKDQNTIHDNESKQDKWNRAIDLFVESVYKPDDVLRSCAHNQKCFTELMEVRTEVLRMLSGMRWH